MVFFPPSMYSNNPAVAHTHRLPVGKKVTDDGSAYQRPERSPGSEETARFLLRANIVWK